MSVVLNGKTYITVAELAAIDPKHQLLDRTVLHVGSGTRVLVRDEPDMLIARWTA